MTIINQTRKVNLATHAKIVTSLKDKSIGLLNDTKPRTIVLKTRFGIHTIGMKFPIDVLILDTNGTIVTMKQSMQPNHIFLWNPKHNTVIELPEGTIAKTKTDVGDTIHIESNKIHV